MVSYYLPIFTKALKTTIKETKAKISWTQAVNLTSFLSLHIVSYYVPIHFKALNTKDKEIIGGSDKFKLSDLSILV